MFDPCKWSPLALLAFLGDIAPFDSRADDTVFDNRCWEQASQTAANDPEACNENDMCRSYCWNSIYTQSYCCIVDSKCWWWGFEPSNDSHPVVRTDSARTGAECRYLCQAEPQCKQWSFHIPGHGEVAGLTEAPGACVLRSQTQTHAATAPKPSRSALGVVSGPRLCVGDSSSGRQAADVVNIGDAKVSSLDSSKVASGILHIDKDANYVTAAAHALLSEGWVVLRNALPLQEVAELNRTAQEAAEEVLRLDPSRIGNRGPRRYSFGGSSKTHHMVHKEAWARLLDNAVLLPLLEAVFGGDYVAVGGGGDFVLGLTDTHQRLHVDLQRPEMYDVTFPPAAIVANFVVSAIGCQDGPMRFFPRTQHLPLSIAEDNSPDDAQHSSLEKEASFPKRLGVSPLIACPLVPGDVLIRDMRLWHGGTPNHGNNTRLLPSAEFLSPWYAQFTQGTEDHFAPRPALPFEFWWQMSATSRATTRRILSIPGLVDAGLRSDFVLLLPYVAEDRF